MAIDSYIVRVPNGVADAIRGMHPHLKRKIRAALGMLLSDPLAGKPLKEELKGLRSLRVSRFRIIYRLRRSTIEMVALGPRSRICEETLLLVKRKA